MQRPVNRPATRPKLDVERVELANGLVVLLSENHATPSVAIKAVVAAGSRYEADEKAGLASFVGEMIDEGTTTRNAQQIAETVEAAGGKLGTYGDGERQADPDGRERRRGDVSLARPATGA